MGTDDLDAVVNASPFDLGEVVLFNRGERSWRLTVTKDGSLPKLYAGQGGLPHHLVSDCLALCCESKRTCFNLPWVLCKWLDRAMIGLSVRIV